MLGMMIIQKLRKKLPSEFEMAIAYFSLLSSLNSLSLTERELQLLAFTAVKGNMTLGNVKTEFCERFSTTFPTISNIVYKLKKQGLLIKEEGRIKTNKQFPSNFKDGITLNIVLQNESITKEGNN
jgi:hypothetical protein